MSNKECFQPSEELEAKIARYQRLQTLLEQQGISSSTAQLQIAMFDTMEEIINLVEDKEALERILWPQITKRK
jgi:hypothetical protein